MTNDNVLEGIRCPSCKSEGPFNIVAAATFIDVTDDGVTDFTGVEWSDQSNIVCKMCGRTGLVWSFKTIPVNMHIKGVDMILLRKQRDHLLTLEATEDILGLTNFLDALLDEGEGYSDDRETS